MGKGYQIPRIMSEDSIVCGTWGVSAEYQGSMLIRENSALFSRSGAMPASWWDSLASLRGMAIMSCHNVRSIA